MKQYEEITMDNYCIQKLECSCNVCQHTFYEYTASNYELVCFEDADGKKYFLPTYGEYGYLDLLEKLVEDWNAETKITHKVTNEFEAKLNELTPYNITMWHRVKCLSCHSNNVTILKREVLHNHPITWVKIDKKKIRDT